MTRHLPEEKADQLLALSEQVNRVAESLAELALRPAETAKGSRRADHRRTLGKSVASEIRARRERARYLPDVPLGEPAWDILLHLLHAELCDCEASLAAVCRASGHPEHVGLRWLDALAAQGLVELRVSANSPPTKIVELMPGARTALRRYFLEVGAKR